MTDENLPPVPPEPTAAPVPPAPPAAAVPPAAPAASPYVAPPAGGPVKQGLSLTAFILGIGAVVFSWAPIFGLLVGIAAIILAVLGRKREPAAPKWMWLVGLILGIIGAVIALFVTIGWIALLAYAASVGSVYNTY